MSQCIYLYMCIHTPATTDIYSLSLHDALPICRDAERRIAKLPPPLVAQHRDLERLRRRRGLGPEDHLQRGDRDHQQDRSEEHTSELQSLTNLVCRLLLEKKKQK